MKSKKIHKELSLFHIVHYCMYIDYPEIEYLNISKKTTQRYIKELTQAGLIRLSFSREKNAYEHIDKEIHDVMEVENKAQMAHLKRLNRLGRIMLEMEDDIAPEFWSEREEGKEYITCKSWYQSQFPECSERTMQRDFKDLTEIGYIVKYDRRYREYIKEFPSGL